MLDGFTRSTTTAMVALLAASVATCATAQVTAKWDVLPNAADMAEVYPHKALEAQIGGRAVIYCMAADDGALKACVIESEEPADQGFGAAAVALSQKFRTAQRKSDGSPMGGTHVRIPLRFEPPRLPARREARYPHAPGKYARFGPAGPYFPDRAARVGARGAALIECRIIADGVLRTCKIVKETPGNFGFGDAALKMAQQGWVVAAPKLTGEPEGPEEVGQLLIAFAHKDDPP